MSLGLQSESNDYGGVYVLPIDSKHVNTFVRTLFTNLLNTYKINFILNAYVVYDVVIKLLLVFVVGYRAPPAVPQRYQTQFLYHFSSKKTASV